MILEHRASIILYNVLSKLQDKGKPFLIPANVCPIVVLTYLKAGVAFELVDISPNNFCLNEEVLLNKISEKPLFYGGVHYVRTFGIENNPYNFFTKIKELNSELFLIDDRCLNIPQFREAPLPIYIDLEFFSTGYSKFVDIGWGGFAYMQQDYKYERRKINYDPKDLEDLIGLVKESIANDTPLIYKDCDWLGDTHFSFPDKEFKSIIKKKIPEIYNHKHMLNEVFSKGLPKEIQLPSQFQNWRYNILVPNKKKLLEEIFLAGLFASSHYPSITNMFGRSACYFSQKYTNNMVNLFNDFRFDICKAERIITLINKHLNKI